MIDGQLILLQQAMTECRRCVTQGHQIVPGAVFSGAAVAEIMVIGQAPGITEVTAKRPFNAGSGRRLFQWLSGAGISEDVFREKQYITAVTKCYPGKNDSGKGDRVPSRQEQSLCREYLNQELEIINPKIIIPVGSLAIRLFFNRKMKLSDVIGKTVYWAGEINDPCPQVDHEVKELYSKVPSIHLSGGRWIVPLPHPSGASLWPNRPENRVLINQAIGLIYDLCILSNIKI